MTLNCKVGDLAIVVQTKATPEMMGLIVKVIAPYNGEFKCPSLCGKRIGIWDLPGVGWIVEGGSQGVPSRSITDKALQYYAQRVVLDSFLRPIRPLDEPEAITTDDEVTA